MFPDSEGDDSNDWIGWVIIIVAVVILVSTIFA